MGSGGWSLVSSLCLREVNLWEGYKMGRVSRDRFSAQREQRNGQLSLPAATKGFAVEGFELDPEILAGLNKGKDGRWVQKGSSQV